MVSTCLKNDGKGFFKCIVRSCPMENMPTSDGQSMYLDGNGRTVILQNLEVYTPKFGGLNPKIWRFKPQNLRFKPQNLEVYTLIWRFQPWKMNGWNLRIIHPWKRKSHLNQSIMFRFYVNLLGCTSSCVLSCLMFILFMELSTKKDKENAETLMRSRASYRMKRFDAWKKFTASTLHGRNVAGVC